MDNNFPEGISFADLEAYLEDAKPEADIQEPVKELSFDEIIDICAEAKSELFRKTKTPLAMKMVILIIMHDMAQWHERMGWETYALEENQKALQEWLGDAGKIKAMSSALADIEITPDDPTPSWKE